MPFKFCFFYLNVWLGEVKVSWILHHQGVQLILAYSWARPAILEAGKVRGGMFYYFFCFFTFIHFRLSPLCLYIISSTILSLFSLFPGWSGGAKVLCILHHWGVQLILAYSWARPAILVVGKGRGGMFLFLLFLHFHSCSSFFPIPLFHLLYSLFYLFSPFLWETTQNDPQGLTCR